MTDAIYCPYSDTIIESADKNQWSWDHVVPLFMGGSDLFQIRCSRRANNDIGSRIEAPMQNDILLSLALRNAGIAGRRGTTTVPEWKYSLVEGRKTHIRLGLDQVTFWDKVDRCYIDLSDRDVVSIETRMKADMFAPLRLGAKIVLGSMTFLFSHSAKTMFDMQPFQVVSRLVV